MTYRCTILLASLALTLVVAGPGSASLPASTSAEGSSLDAIARQRIATASAALAALQARPDAAPHETANAWGELGACYHAFGQKVLALEALTQATQLAPTTARWHAGRGRVEAELGKTTETIASLERAVELEPDDLASWVRLGDALLEGERPTAAHHAYQRVLDRDDEVAAAWFGLGRAAIALDDDAAGAAHLERALALQPAAGTIRYPLGQARRRLGDLDEARAQLAQATDQMVKLDDPWYRRLEQLAAGSAVDRLSAEVALGADPRVLFERAARGFDLAEGEEEQLRSELEGGALPPKTAARFAHVLAALTLRGGDEEGGTALLQRALALDPALLDAHVRLGNAAARKQDFDAAAAAYRRALAINSTDPEALAKLAAVLLFQKDASQARTLLETLVAAHPYHFEGQLRLGDALEDLGDSAQATSHYRRLLERELRQRERADVHHRLARLSMRANDPAGALEHGRQALEADSSHIPAMADTAAILVSTGRFTGAVQIYERWIELEPENPAPRSLLGGALILAGRDQEARDALERALSTFPNDEKVLDLLARHLAASDNTAVRNPARALELAQRAFQIAATAQRVETLAMALAATGNFPAAADLMDQLVSQLERAGRASPATLERLRQDLERYRKGG